MGTWYRYPVSKYRETGIRIAEVCLDISLRSLKENMKGSVVLWQAGRWILANAIAICVLMLGLSAGQERPLKPQEPQDRASTDRGLTVDLSQGETLEPSESIPLQSCLAEHPPLFCVLLTLVLTNTGKNTILLWSSSCYGPSITFDLRRSDGSWRNFPKMGIVCGSNVLGVQSLAPHESSIVHIRMADLFLDLETNEVRAEVAGRGPFVIRANWTIWGCAASGKLKKGASLELPPTSSLCAKGTVAKPDFAVLRSNELQVRF